MSRDMSGFGCRLLQCGIFIWIRYILQSEFSVYVCKHVADFTVTELLCGDVTMKILMQML